MQVVVIGGGPAGCRASELLAGRGHEVVLIDAQGPWEKPCGGGVTARARAGSGPALAAVPHREIARITLHFGDRASVTLAPKAAPIVVSRRDLGLALLEAAERAGVRFIRSRAGGLERREGRWIVHTREAAFAADLLVGADGATSFVRRKVGAPLAGGDLAVTLGYFLPIAAEPHMKIYFLPGFEGYIWSFPRPDHISYGLITRPAPGWPARSRALLEKFIHADLGAEALEDAESYSAPVPALGPRAWERNRITGEGWALVGDAAGLVDPITGEGIHYALRSAALLADSCTDLAGYADAVGRECVAELAEASAMSGRFYGGRFLGGAFIQRMVQVAGRSSTVREVLGDLIAGTQPYRGLKRRLLRSAPRAALECVRPRRPES